MPANADGLERRALAAEKNFLGDAKVRLYKSVNHLSDFIKCVRSREKPVASEIAGGTTAIACHLMGIADRTATDVKWDPVKRELVGHAIDAKELTRPYRGAWRL